MITKLSASQVKLRDLTLNRESSNLLLQEQMHKHFEGTPLSLQKNFQVNAEPLSNKLTNAVMEAKGVQTLTPKDAKKNALNKATQLQETPLSKNEDDVHAYGNPKTLNPNPPQARPQLTIVQNPQYHGSVSAVTAPLAPEVTTNVNLTANETTDANSTSFANDFIQSRDTYLFSSDFGANVYIDVTALNQLQYQNDFESLNMVDASSTLQSEEALLSTSLVGSENSETSNAEGQYLNQESLNSLIQNIQQFDLESQDFKPGQELGQQASIESASLLQEILN